VTPLEFAEYIFNIRRESGVSRPVFSKKWGYHTNTIKSYEKEGRLPPVDYVAALSIETGESFIPLLNMLLSIGPLSNTDHSLALETLISAPQAGRINEGKVKYSKEGSILQYRVESDSMSPTIVKDAIVTYEVSKDRGLIKDGDVLLLTIDKSIVLRRVQLSTDGQYVLSCDNPNYNATTYDRAAFDKLNIVGIAKYTLNPV
jgi:phage repressor protein C with HTH and peptisase S24 domain